jgi:hypothetical protein
MALGTLSCLLLKLCRLCLGLLFAIIQLIHAIVVHLIPVILESEIVAGVAIVY